MSRPYRLSLIGLSLVLLVVVGRLVTGDFQFVMNDFWFASGLLLLILLSLIDQPHFSKDSNIFVNSIAAGISLLLVDQSDRDFVYGLFFVVTIYLAVSSYILLWVRQRALAEEPASTILFSRLNRELGKPESLFSAFFLWGAVRQFGVQSLQFNALLLFWMIFMVLNVPSIARAIADFASSPSQNETVRAIGQIFGVQSKDTFMVKMFPLRERPSVKAFDFVEFKYSMDNKTRKGLVLDNYLLNQEQWIKVLSNRQIDSVFDQHQIIHSPTLDLVYPIDANPKNEMLDRLVGIVTDESRINNIRFIYNSRAEIAEGDLLEVLVGSTTVLYQVIEGRTKIEVLEHKNQTGLIVGEAIQLGSWNKRKFQFEQFGWVPNVNAPVFLAAKIAESQLLSDEYEIGHIPGTSYPVAINKRDALSHHLAILGVTGSGKSVFARNLLRELIKDPEVKVICVDFTGEYSGKLGDMNLASVIPEETEKDLFKKIDEIEKEVDGNYSKDTDTSRSLKKEVAGTLNEKLREFLTSEQQLSVFELPNVENTSGVMTYTKAFFRNLFHIAKTANNFGKRVCVVLEEAHTIVPEWNFSGVSDKVSRPLLNSIAQIALQGRKYNVGLIVIAQRTANVSKTILTQCNTIVAFQLFDKTSEEFLSNYFGQDIAGSLPKLKFRHAIAAGKGFRAGVPMIFEVPEISEHQSDGDTPAVDEAMPF